MRDFTNEELEQISNKIYKECLTQGMEEDGVVAANVLVTLDLIKKFVLEMQTLDH